MNLSEHPLYKEDLRIAASNLPDWELFRNKTFLITGATGTIGSFIVDLLMYQNSAIDLQAKIVLVSRDVQRAKRRFPSCSNDSSCTCISQDLNEGFNFDGGADYILHLASNTHPVAYATDPIGTILTNVVGYQHLLEWAVKTTCKRIIYASSVEVYGEVLEGMEFFDESSLGYIDCNTLRAGYPESKRVGEALSQAYRHARGLDIVIARLSRIYGPTMLKSDSKAMAQFINNGVNAENITLKSAGTQQYSYTYVADAVGGLLLLLTAGIDGQAYNIAGLDSDCTLFDIASMIAGHSGTEVVFDLPSDVERAGYSKATKAVLSTEKIREIGYAPQTTMQHGLSRTVDILKDIRIGQRDS